MSKLKELLHRAGLAGYAALFAENDVDDEVLAELNEDDLKELGLSLGERKRFLKARAALGADGPAAAPRSPRATAEPEHRQLTVMFCDLVDSTALSERLHVEVYREVLASYRSAATRGIETFGGYVARYLGDGLLAYFGYPQAHEDDAERSIRAALEVQQALRSLGPPRLEVRIGIATGPVVAGDVIGEGASEEHAVLGETPNLAARLEQLAKPGQALVSSRTRALAGELFSYEEVGSRRLKGFSQPVRAWRVTSVVPSETRFEATRSPDRTPLIGRDTELRLLLERWERARDAEGQIVLLSGEPGIGKSRLAHALRRRIAAEPHAVLRHQCSPHYANSAFYPFIEHLQRGAGFASGDDGAAKLAKLEAWLLREGLPGEELRAAFRALLSLSAPGDPVSETSAQAQRERIAEALTERLVLKARAAPLLLLFEDVHWADATTLDVLGRIIERTPEHAILLVISHRPEFNAPWKGRGRVTAHSLARLGRRQVTELIRGVTGGRSLPEALVADVVDKADGVPLFVEELTKTVIEAGFLRKAGNKYVLAGPLPSIPVPSTLRDSLVARLDRLAMEKDVAQIASVIGREFSYELLAAVSDLADEALAEALERLEAAEIVFRTGDDGEVTYSFKHALVQEAAYDSLLESRRVQLHADIAIALEEGFPETVAVEPERMAHHYAAAGQMRDAIEYWRTAAQAAVDQSAYPEALAHLDAALQAREGVTDEGDLDRAELDIQIARGGALMVLEGYASTETEAAFSRARALARELGDGPKSFAALRGLLGIHTVRAELTTALGIAEECLAIAEAQGNLASVALAERLLGQTLCLMGELDDARRHLERSLELGATGDSPGIALAQGGHRLMTQAFLSHVLWMQGFGDRAVALAQSGLERAETEFGAFEITANLYFLSWLHGWRRDFEALDALNERMQRLTAEHAISAWLSTPELLPDWSKLSGPESAKRAALARRRLKEVRAQAGLRTPFKLGVLAAAFPADRAEAALEIVEEALRRTRETGERWSEPELLRIKGELLWHAADAEAAERCYQASLDAAASQGALSWGLRTATCLARLWREQGKTAEALDALTSLYGQFSEGFDTADLREAKELIDSLS